MRPEGRFIRRSGTPLTRADDLLRLSRASPRWSDGSLTRRGRPLRPGGTRLRVSRGPLRHAEQVLRRSDAPLCARDLPASSEPRLSPACRLGSAAQRCVARASGPYSPPERRCHSSRRPPSARRPRTACAERPCPALRPRTAVSNRHGYAPRPLPAWARGQPLSPCLHSAASHRSIHRREALWTKPRWIPLRRERRAGRWGWARRGVAWIGS